MLTISKLAKKFNISRASILYYEREELLLPASRTDNGYRWYGEKEQEKLQTIINYRSFGIPVNEIRELIKKSESNAQNQILRKQFDHLEKEIQGLKQQQLAIVNFLNAPELLDGQGMTKEKWTQIMQSSGMNDKDMLNWHRQFEKLEPESHQEFLESLQISKDEIKLIRAQSKS